MSLPTGKLKSPKGQILIIFLLVLVVGAAIVLSVASRTITDIKTTTTSDESNRAYFAAEAGIEEALRSSPPIGGSLNFSNVNATAIVTTSGGSGGDTFVYPEDIRKDEVVQVNMLSNFNDINSAGWGGSELNFYWGRDLVGNDPNQAIEVSIVWYNAGNFGITKIAFDPVVARGNNFCDSPEPFSAPGEPLTDNTLGSANITKNFYFRAGIFIRGVGGDLDPGCADNRHGSPISGNPVIIRIRALYNTAPMPIAVTVGAGEPDLYSQALTIESTGQTTSGVTRKLQVIRLYPAAPALFDYVLFNGGCKTYGTATPPNCTEYYPLQK